MDIIKRALHQVKQVLFFISFLTSFVNALLVFLFCILVLLLFSVSWIFAGIPFVLFLIFNTAKNMKRVGYKDIEQRIPDLEWKLRTSADNVDREDELALDLHNDVLDKLYQVKATRIINKRQTASKLAAVLGLLLLIVFVSVQGITYDDLKENIQDGISPVTGFFSKLTNMTEISLTDEEQQDIYGETEDVQYGNKEEIIELNQMVGLVDIKQYDKNKEGKTFKGTSSAQGNREALGSETSKEKISEEDKEIVNNYFKSINREQK